MCLWHHVTKARGIKAVTQVWRELGPSADTLRAWRFPLLSVGLPQERCTAFPAFAPVWVGDGVGCPPGRPERAETARVLCARRAHPRESQRPGWHASRCLGGPRSPRMVFPLLSASPRPLRLLLCSFLPFLTREGKLTLCHTPSKCSHTHHLI